MRTMLAFAAALFLAATSNAFAQNGGQESPPAQPTETPAPASNGSPGTTETNPQVKAYKDATELNNARRAYYQSQKDLAGTLTPTIPHGKDGTVAFNGDSPVETAAMAYEALRAISKDIAARASCGSTDHLLLYGQADVNGIESLDAFYTQAGIIKKRLLAITELDKTVKPPAGDGSRQSPALAMALVGPTIEALNNLISLFRADVSFNVKDVTLDEKALVALVASALREAAKTCGIYYPDAIPSGLLGSPKKLNDEITLIGDLLADIRGLQIKRTADEVQAQEKIKDLTKKRDDMQAVVDSLNTQQAEIDKLTRELEELNPKKDSQAIKELRAELDKKKKSLAKDTEAHPAAQPVLNSQSNELVDWKEYQQKLARLLAMFDTAITAGDAFFGALAKTEEPSGLTLLAKLGRAERLKTVLEDNRPGSYAMQLSVQKLAGTTKTSSRFFTGTRVSFSGGAVASFLEFRLYDGQGKPDGALVQSGSFNQYTGFRRPNEIKGQLLSGTDQTPPPSGSATSQSGSEAGKSKPAGKSKI